MIPKENKLVITFSTTTAAMAMEHRCRQQGLPGRMIPVPPSISAGCGLAWSAPPESEELLRRFLAENQITPQAIRICPV